VDVVSERALHAGLVIPAHPLALTVDRRLDEDRQRALTRYYVDAGAGGVAVGVHTTQFAIHKPAVGLYRPVLELAVDVLQDSTAPLVRVAGVLGPTERAVQEAEIAAGLGYDLALVAASSWGDAPEQDILAGIAAVGDILPVFGFYLQPPVGGLGGLLGQFAVWTAAAVHLLSFIRQLTISRGPIPPVLLEIGAQLTDAKAAVFDVAHGFRGCIPGIHHVLNREGVLAGRWCLDPDEDLSTGQETEIDRVWRAYPHLRDPELLAAQLAKHCAPN
jgi:hypothetical protein